MAEEKGERGGEAEENAAHIRVPVSRAGKRKCDGCGRAEKTGSAVREGGAGGTVWSTEERKRGRRGLLQEKGAWRE